MSDKPTVSDVRDYWNRRPCNIRHSPSQVGTKEFYEEVEARKYFVEPHIPPFADFSHWKGKKVLEIGCGIGTDTINFARAGAKVTAVDLSEESLNVTRKRVQLFGLQDQIDLVQADCETLSEFVKVEPYDLIYSFGVIHHTPRPDRAVAEMLKYCHRGTEVRLMVYSKVSVKSLQMLLSRVTCEAQPGVPVAYTYTRFGIRRLLSPHFKAIFLRKEHIFPWKISDYTRYTYTKHWFWRWMPKFLFHGLERLFGWHWLVVAVPCIR